MSTFLPIGRITNFPDGKPGVALLVLRVALGATLLLESLVKLRSPADWAVLQGCIGLVLSVLLVIGLCTPIAGLVAMAMGVQQWSNDLSVPSNPSFLFSMAIALATILMGPGATSIDARLFGRREIIIPSPRQHTSDDGES